MSEIIDLGDGHSMKFTGYYPDRELNPHAKDHPDVEKFGALINHRRPDNGEECWSHVNFDGPVQRKVMPDAAIWKVESEDPLTLSPSILCRLCGDHGWIREGKWVKG